MKKLLSIVMSIVMLCGCIAMFGCGSTDENLYDLKVKIRFLSFSSEAEEYEIILDEENCNITEQNGISLHGANYISFSYRFFVNDKKTGKMKLLTFDYPILGELYPNGNYTNRLNFSYEDQSIHTNIKGEGLWHFILGVNPTTFKYINRTNGRKEETIKVKSLSVKYNFRLVP